MSCRPVLLVLCLLPAYPYLAACRGDTSKEANPVAEKKEAADPTPNDGDEGEEDEKEEWSIESPPGPSSEQPIDVTEGTWVTVDVHPNGREIVFDLLGDLYVLPITDAERGDGKPEKLRTE